MSSQKTVVLSHAFGGKPELVFYPAVKKTLEAAGYSVQIPAFPDTESPVFGPWQSTLGEALNRLKPENTIMVGHSLGCINILRFLESRTDLAEPYAGVILVAPSAMQAPVAGNWTEKVPTFFAAPYDLPSIKRNSRQFITIHAIDDVLVGTPLEHARQFQEMLGSKIIMLPKGGHFWTTDNCTELPEVTAAVIDIFEGLRTRA
ncbi:Alpha/Beta hydrolase protein [Endogone sp. FLAS-F59071]|nr:Alpha/Beta hydrolase protein [Endogone sp. FLAS-F59071]|eukprot:RUS13621.1 Alpha/Beta hydrolase protein [Endogone sp. FLAS-F59071]